MSANAMKRRERVERGIYRNPKTGRYEITFTDSDGKQRWQSVEGNLKVARAARAEVVAKLGKGQRVAPSKLTLEHVGVECMAAQRHLRPRTKQVYETNLRVHVYATLGKRKVADIDVNDVAKLIGRLEAKGLKPWTIRGVLSALGRVLNYAARHGMIPANPIRLLERGERPRVEQHEMRFLDMGEIERLFDKVLPGYRAAITCAIFTGLRQGELLGLQWRDVHFGAEPSDTPDGERFDGFIGVRFQLDRSGERAALKTANAVREVPLFEALAKVLRQHREAMLARGHAAPDDYVFTTLTGAPLSWRNLSARGLEKAAERAGLIPTREERKKAKEAGEDAGPVLRFHDLRHSYAALGADLGWSDGYLSKVMGHSSAAFTQTVYGHLFDRRSKMRAASASLEARFGAVVESTLENTGGETRRTGAANLGAKVAQLRVSGTGGD